MFVRTTSFKTYCTARKSHLTRVAALLALVVAGFIFPGGSAIAKDAADSSVHNGANKPAVITSLDNCPIPGFLVAKIRHMSPAQIQQMQEEYQQTALDDDAEEVLITVKLHFEDDHIVGIVKKVPINSTSDDGIVSYVDVPVEWMCVPSSPDHPFHFAKSLAEIQQIKDEFCCEEWVQRDAEIEIHFAAQEKGKPKKTQRKKN